MKSVLIGFAGLAVVLGLLVAAARWAVEAVYYPGQPSVDFPEPADQREARLQDLTYFRLFLDLDRSYTDETRQRAMTQLDQLEERLTDLTEAQFQLEIAEAVATADNGHTNIWLGRFSRAHGRLPLRLFWFADGLYVVRARSDFGDLVGSRLRAVNGTPVEQAAERFRAYVGGTEAGFRAYRGPILIELPSVHHAAGLTSNEAETRMTFTLREGGVVTRTLASEPLAEGAPLFWPGSYLLAVLPEEDAVEDDWVTLAERVPAPPRYLQQPQQPFQQLPLPGGGRYLQYRQNFGPGIEAFNADVRAALAADPPAYVVVDHRFNGGGDYTLTEALMTDLPQLLAADARLYTVTGNATFSAGINSVAFLRASGAERVVILGERIGDRERSYGETNDFVLPNSGMGMTFNTGLHDVASGCPPFPQCYYRNYFSDVAVGSLDPDVTIPLTAADYRAGRDPVLEWVLAREAGID
ncbi:MAG: hypothetical protein AAGG11_13880 [Pseudomonadota bacterium]